MDELMVVIVIVVVMIVLLMVMVMVMVRCWRKKEQPDSCQESTIGTVGLAGLHQSNNV